MGEKVRCGVGETHQFPELSAALSSVTSLAFSIADSSNPQCCLQALIQFREHFR